MKPGGKVGIILPDGILNNKSKQYVRDYIKENSYISGIVSLNKETFEAYGAKAKTSILFLENKKQADSGEQDEVFMAIADETGYASNGDRIPENDLPEILMEYKKFINEDIEDGFPDDSPAWTENIKDRLDAEYYDISEHDPGVVHVEDIEENFGSSLQAIVEEYETVTNEINSIFEEINYENYKIGKILEEKSVREKVDDDELYPLLKVKWWGGGVEKKAEKYGREMETKTKYRVKSPWIIYNKLFAETGSFAVIGEEYDGCYVSVEFPTFDVREDFDNKDLLRKYIVRYMNTPQYQDRISAQNTGSTKESRGRFHPEDFLQMEIKVPKSKEDMEKIVRLLDSATKIKFSLQELEDRSDELLNNVGGMLPGPSSEPKINQSEKNEQKSEGEKSNSEDQSNLDSFE